MPACLAGIESIPYRDRGGLRKKRRRFLISFLGEEGGGSTDDETHKDKRSEETEVFRRWSKMANGG